MKWVALEMLDLKYFPKQYYSKNGYTNDFSHVNDLYHDFILQIQDLSTKRGRDVFSGIQFSLKVMAEQI